MCKSTGLLGFRVFWTWGFLGFYDLGFRVYVGVSQNEEFGVPVVKTTVFWGSIMGSGDYHLEFRA